MDKETEKDIVDVSRQFLQNIQEEEQQNPEIRQNAELRNISLTEADMHMFGDRTILAEITQLMSYIRHALRNNANMEISVKIGKSDQTVANSDFNFDVNGCQVPDLIAQNEIYIN